MRLGRTRRRGSRDGYGLLGDYFTDPAIVADLYAQVGQIGAEVITTILGRAARREKAREDFAQRAAMLPLDLFRHEVPGDRALPCQRVRATRRSRVRDACHPLQDLDPRRARVFRGPTPPDEHVITEIVDQVFPPLVRLRESLPILTRRVTARALICGLWTLGERQRADAAALPDRPPEAKLEVRRHSEWSR